MAVLRSEAKSERWRIRVGDWRIGYEIDDEKRIVRIVAIGHRRDFYD